MIFNVKRYYTLNQNQPTLVEKEDIRMNVVEPLETTSYFHFPLIRWTMYKRPRTKRSKDVFHVTLNNHRINKNGWITARNPQGLLVYTRSIGSMGFRKEKLRRPVRVKYKLGDHFGRWMQKHVKDHGLNAKYVVQVRGRALRPFIKQFKYAIGKYRPRLNRRRRAFRKQLLLQLKRKIKKLSLKRVKQNKNSLNKRIKTVSRKTAKLLFKRSLNKSKKKLKRKLVSYKPQKSYEKKEKYPPLKRKRYYWKNKRKRKKRRPKTWKKKHSVSLVRKVGKLNLSRDNYYKSNHSKNLYVRTMIIPKKFTRIFRNRKTSLPEKIPIPAYLKRILVKRVYADIPKIKKQYKEMVLWLDRRNRRKGIEMSHETLTDRARLIFWGLVNRYLNRIFHIAETLAEFSFRTKQRKEKMKQVRAIRTWLRIRKKRRIQHQKKINFPYLFKIKQKFLKGFGHST